MTDSTLQEQLKQLSGMFQNVENIRSELDMCLWLKLPRIRVQLELLNQALYESMHLVTQNIQLQCDPMSVRPTEVRVHHVPRETSHECVPGINKATCYSCGKVVS